VDLSLDAELSGLTVIKQARQCWPDAIVIAMSADRSQHVQALSLKAGAWAFLGKPISEHVLGHTLERCKVGDP
jgi:CheY-like chemotaxis protein